MCINRIHVMKVDVRRICLPYQGGGRELMNLEKEYKETMVGINEYMKHKAYVQIKALLKHCRSKAVHSVSKEAEKYLNKARTTDNVTKQCSMTATQRGRKFKRKCQRHYKKLIKAT